MRKLLHILTHRTKTLIRGKPPPEKTSSDRKPFPIPAELSVGEDFRLAIASRFFDAGWYSARYPEVAATGLDPLSHFLRLGIAEGRDPGPLFDGKWYLANNPDVAAAGTNPLIHYFQSGAAEGRDPNPSAILRKKIKRSAKQLESFTPGQVGEKANDYNTLELRTTWQNYFLSQGIDAYKRSDLAASLKYIIASVQMCPEANDAFSLFDSVFVEYNGESLRLFERTYATSKLIVAHVSCKPNLARAELSASSFSDSTSEVTTLRVIGDASLPENKFNFDVDRRLLIVPANDAYESLPAKVIKLFLFLGLARLSVPILKLDDDVICDDVAALKTTLNEVLANSDYGGRVLPPATRLGDSQFWHFRKCKNPDINFRPDGMFFFFAYVAGACYWLSEEAINLLSKVALLHDRYFEIEFYEDRAVGTSLNYYGIRPYHYDLIASGRLRYANPDMQKRHLNTLSRITLQTNLSDSDLK